MIKFKKQNKQKNPLKTKNKQQQQQLIQFHKVLVLIH